MSNSTAPITNPSSFISSSSSSLPHTTSAPVSTTPTFTPTVSTLPDTSSVVIVSSVVTESAANGNTAPTTIFITSTAPVTSQSFLPTTASKSSTSSSSSSSSAALTSNTASASKKGSSGLSSGGKVAIAVVVPVVAVAVLIVLGIWFWRRRKARKNSEELRKNEIEEYGFNPNNDPTLPPVGSGDGTSPGMTEDNSGYRGWGATSTQRQPSTNLSSGRGGIGVAVSDEGSNGHQPGSPGHPSEAYSNEPLVAGPYGDRPTSGDSETIGALPPVAAGGKQHENIHRGPSNASSAYSTANRSDGSADAPIPVENTSGPQLYEDGQNYYNESAQPSHGPYGDGSYGGTGQPVIRDVQARRNMQIQKPSVYPPQGNSGIAQNF